MPVYFIRSDQIDDQNVSLTPDLSHHLRDVLRLKVGELLTLVDEKPKGYRTRVTASYPNPLQLKIESEVAPEGKQLGSLHLAVGMLKGEKMDWVIQKACELGVSELTPLITERTVVRVRPERLPHQQARWLKIATEASQQSCRWSLPKINPPVDLTTFLEETSSKKVSSSKLSSKDFRLIFSERTLAEPCAETIRLKIAESPEAGTLLVGPEGGWTPAEESEALKADFRAVSLGEQILRAETAALAALSIVQYEMRNGSTQHPSNV